MALKSADASSVFPGLTFTYEDDRFAYGEQRFITLGLLEQTLVAIAHTEDKERLAREAGDRGSCRSCSVR